MVIYGEGINKFLLQDLKGTILDFDTQIGLTTKNEELSQAYYFKAGSEFMLDFKEKACLDWSKAGELGYRQAYEKIKMYCN